MRSIVPVPRVHLNGASLPDTFELDWIRLVQRLDAPAQCELSWNVSNIQSAHHENPEPEPGTVISVEIEGEPDRLFTGEITSIEHEFSPSGTQTVHMRAYDPLVKLQRQQSINTRVDITTAELARALANDAGLPVQGDTEGPVWPRIIPRFRHDLALLRHYCHRSGLHFLVQDDALQLFPMEAAEEADLALVPGKNLMEVRVEHNRVQPVEQVQVMGWDPHRGDARRGKVGSGSAAKRTLLGAAVESDEEAEALARAEHRFLQGNAAVFSGVAEGDVNLAPGQCVEVRGLNRNSNGVYRLTSVVHSITTGGYRCELSSRPERPAREEAAGVPALIFGEVCDVDDPDGQGRIQVNLNSFNEAVTTWMLVVQIGAGDDKGLVALPEVGDRVLVALPDGDPSRGIVLGGVYRSEGPPWRSEAARSPGAQRPYLLTTQGGQQVQLNDADGSLLLQNASGSYLALTEEGLTLHAVGELVVEAPGQRLVLGGKAIDMETR